MTRTGHAGEVDGNGRTASAGYRRTKGRATTVALPFVRVSPSGAHRSQIAVPTRPLMAWIQLNKILLLSLEPFMLVWSRLDVAHVPCADVSVMTTLDSDSVVTPH